MPIVIKQFAQCKMAVRTEADLAVCREVIEKQVYIKPRLGFTLNSNEIWIDAGANIGAFSVWAEKLFQAKVYGFEACHENTVLANKNLILNNCCSRVTTGFISANEDGFSKVGFNRKTPARSSTSVRTETRMVQNFNLNQAIKLYKPNGLKIDIEGGEFDLLDNGIDLNGVRAVAIEYHFRFDKDCIKARKRLQPFLDTFKFHSIPKQILSNRIWPAWQDAICFFWT